MYEEHQNSKLFENLFSKYYSPFCLYAKRYIGDMEVCKNIVSDVFVVLWTKKDEIDFESKTILGYLKTSIRNSCLNYIKHLEYEWKHEEAMQNAPPAYSSSPETIYTLNELYEILNDTLDSLPPQYKDIFIKSFIEEKQQKMIAEELNISTKSVYRFREKLFLFLREKLSDFKMLTFFF